MMGCLTACGVIIGVIGGAEGVAESLIHSLPGTTSIRDDQGFRAVFLLIFLGVFLQYSVGFRPAYLPPPQPSFAYKRLLGTFTILAKGCAGRPFGAQGTAKQMGLPLPARLPHILVYNAD